MFCESLRYLAQQIKKKIDYKWFFKYQESYWKVKDYTISGNFVQKR